jgi:hypothetical protein
MAATSDAAMTHTLSGFQRMSPVGEAEADTNPRRADGRFLMHGVEDMR